jgi:glycerol-3-phosphate acyltransferase PlsY
VVRCLFLFGWGNIFFDLDVHQFGDGNPGATNVFKSGNKLVGLVALMLDISKAAVPVGLADFNWNIRGLPIVLIAIAPFFGHAFSPFLGLKVGKGIATALGIWIGLTIWKVSLPGAMAAVIGIALFTPPGWSVVLALGTILITILIWLPDQLLIWVWISETLIVTWIHRVDLRQTPQLRAWLLRTFGRLGTKANHG